MADAAAPAPELKEYPEFPGQKLSKSEYKKMLKRQKADEEKAAKAAAKVRLQKLLRALSSNSKMRALKPFFVFFSKNAPLFCPPCCDRFIKTSFVFSVLRHMVVVVGKKKY
jgi:hypothetical protein